MYFELSNEQKDIMFHFHKNQNIFVNAVAGSGKSTTVFLMAKEEPNKKMLFLTYNARLKEESRQKQKLMKIKNMEVHNYHSFFKTYYDKHCISDKVLIQYYDKQKELEKIKEIPDYDVVVFDECQDMTMIYYYVACLVLKEMQHNQPQLIVIGDENQNIFSFQGSDHRFLSQCSKLYHSFTENPWQYCSLPTTYRCSNKICDFVNMCIEKSENTNKFKMKPSVISDEKVEYYCFDTFDPKEIKTIVKYIIKVVEKYTPSQVFVLASSVRSEKTPIRLIANELKNVNSSISIYVPLSDEEQSDKDIMHNKLVFTTFHQVKGLERDVSIIINFDENSYHLNQNKLFPNELYVGMTRCRTKLILIQHFHNMVHSFIDKQFVKDHCITNVNQDWINNTKKLTFREDKKFKYPVTNVMRHFSAYSFKKILENVELIYLNEETKKIQLRQKVFHGDLCESVSEISGTAIPAFYEWLQTGQMSIFDQLIKVPVWTSCSKNKRDNWLTIPQINEKLLKLVTLYCSINSGYNFKKKQIKQYKWITTAQLKLCVQRLKRFFSKYEKDTEDSMSFEYPVENQYCSGVIDCYSESTGTIYEFKCVNQIKDEHILQLSFYAYLLFKENGSIPRCILYNILSNETIELKFTPDSLENLYEKTMEIRKNVSSCINISDEEFIEECQNISHLLVSQ